MRSTVKKEAEKGQAASHIVAHEEGTERGSQLAGGRLVKARQCLVRQKATTRYDDWEARPATDLDEQTKSTRGKKIAEGPASDDDGSQSKRG